MRAALLALLLANLAFFAWARWLAPPGATEVVSAPLTVPQVSLARERPAVAVTPPVARRCVSVGPFATAEEAAHATQVLGPSALRAQQRGESMAVPDGYWVHVGGFDSAADLMLALRRLRREGMADAKAMPPSPEGRRISAGIFTSRERADAVAARVQSLGLQPVVTERTREEHTFWLDLELAAGAADLTPETLQSGAPGAQLQVKPCPLPVAPAAAAEPAADGTSEAPQAAPAGETPATEAPAAAPAPIA